MSGADRTGGVAAGTGLLPIVDGASVDEQQLGQCGLTTRRRGQVLTRNTLERVERGEWRNQSG